MRAVYRKRKFIMTGKLAVNLAPTKIDQDRESLGSLLEKALHITAPGSKKDSARNKKSEATWICRWAIRAVADEIIRTGKLQLPLRVQFAEHSSAIPNWRLEYDGDYGLN